MDGACDENGLVASVCSPIESQDSKQSVTILDAVDGICLYLRLGQTDKRGDSRRQYWLSTGLIKSKHSDGRSYSGKHTSKHYILVDRWLYSCKVLERMFNSQGNDGTYTQATAANHDCRHIYDYLVLLNQH